MAVMQVKMMFVEQELHFCLVKRWKISKIHTKSLPHGSRESLGAPEHKRDQCYLFLQASWPPFGPVLGPALGPQRSLWGATGPIKGVQNTLPRGKKSFQKPSKWHLHANFITEQEFYCFFQFWHPQTIKKLIEKPFKIHVKNESTLVATPKYRHA